MANSKDTLFFKNSKFQKWTPPGHFLTFSLKMRPNFFVKVFLPQNLDFEPNEGALEPPIGFLAIFFTFFLKNGAVFL